MGSLTVQVDNRSRAHKEPFGFGNIPFFISAYGYPALCHLTVIFITESNVPNECLISYFSPLPILFFFSLYPPYRYTTGLLCVRTVSRRTSPIFPAHSVVWTVSQIRKIPSLLQLSFRYLPRASGLIFLNIILVLQSSKSLPLWSETFSTFNFQQSQFLPSHMLEHALSLSSRPVNTPQSSFHTLPSPSFSPHQLS